MTTGTHDISTLLASRDTSAAEFGLNNILPIINGELARHNAIVTTLVNDLATFTTDRQRKYGISVAGDMHEVDEYGRAPTQVSKPGATVGFPLKMFQYALGWTRKWFELHTPADMVIAVQGGERAHLRMYSREIKRAFLLSGNYTWDDFLVDGVDLAVKRLVNADSAPIPEGPNGETFTASTHTHYVGEASLLASFVTAEISNVLEHGHGNMIRIAISATDEAAFRALTGFVAYTDPRLTMSTAADSLSTRLDITRANNRAIGIFGAAEVWVKSWMPASYLFFWDAGSDKPLVIRQRTSTSMQGLRIAGALDAFPLYAEYMESEFGVGVNTRTNGSVLYTGNATYSDPTVTS